MWLPGTGQRRREKSGGDEGRGGGMGAAHRHTAAAARGTAHRHGEQGTAQQADTAAAARGTSHRHGGDSAAHGGGGTGNRTSARGTGNRATGIHADNEPPRNARTWNAEHGNLGHAETHARTLANVLRSFCARFALVLRSRVRQGVSSGKFTRPPLPSPGKTMTAQAFTPERPPTL